MHTTRRRPLIALSIVVLAMLGCDRDKQAGRPAPTPAPIAAPETASAPMAASEPISGVIPADVNTPAASDRPRAPAVGGVEVTPGGGADARGKRMEPTGGDGSAQAPVNPASR